MVDPAGVQGNTQGLGDMLLPDNFGEGRGAISPV
jgi:hypothetical protein